MTQLQKLSACSSALFFAVAIIDAIKTDNSELLVKGLLLAGCFALYNALPNKK
jgi:hypothetical protein